MWSDSRRNILGRVLCRAVGAAYLRAVVCVSLAARASPALGQGDIIGGVVVAERSLRPIAGAQILAEDTTVRTVTDANGRFRLARLREGDVRITVRRIGYHPLQHTARAGQTDLRLVLSEIATTLNDVVVTGTSVATARRALGNAVTSVNAPEVMERGTASSVQQLLNGRVPGMVVQPSTGLVGGGARITVRGGTSLTLANDPLLYIDGVRANAAPATGPSSQLGGPGPISRLNDLDPNDIERIEVIKGPAAATLYGTEASTGVINIITKQGPVGPARWNAHIKLGTNYLRDPEGRFPTNYERDTAGRVIAVDVVDRESAFGRPLFRNGLRQEYHLSADGGNEQARYYLAGGYEHSDGVESLNELRKGSGRVNLTLIPSSRLTATVSLGYTSGPTRLSPEGGFGMARIRNTVLADPRNLPDGGGDTTRRGFLSVLPEEYDLLASHGMKFEQQLERLTTSLRVEHQPIGWLRQRLRVGFDRTGTTNDLFVPRVEAIIAKGIIPTLNHGYKEIAHRGIRYHTLDYTATASADIARALRSSTSIGGQYYRTDSDGLAASGAGFPVEGLGTISATTAFQMAAESVGEDVTIGVFAQQEIAWRDRVFITAALRADDNSAFGDDFDRVYYPKVSLSWVASDEAFLRAQWLKALRLRAAYGEAGKQPSTFDALATYQPVTGPRDAPAVTPLSVGNPALGPERGKEIEFGVDASVLDDRLTLELTWYDKRTVDAILQRQVAPSAGVPGVQLFNAGELRNTGIELLTRAVPLRGEQWAWELSLSLATNDNKIISLGDGVVAVPAAVTFQEYQVGRPAGAWFEKRVVSAVMDSIGSVSSAMCDDGEGGATPCAGADGTYGTADDAPIVYLGRSIPKAEGALASTVRLLGRRLRVYALADFKTGHHKFDQNTFARCTSFRRCRENYFPAEFDARRIAAIGSNGNLVDYVIKDASFAKLREVSVSYLLPDPWAAAIGVRRANVSLAGRELHTWARYDGLDVEGRVRGGNYSNSDAFIFPQLSQWVVVVNLGF